MTIPVKKLKSGFEMSVFGFGTWQMGGRMERDRQNDDQTDILAIQTALDRGITHIDTAEMYANGYTEILIGKALKERDRSKIFLVSKVKSENLGYDDTLKACEKSLERLQVDYLDLYLMHRYSDQYPLKDTIRALDRLKAEGLIRHIGVANFGKEHLAEAQSYTSNQIVCDQVHYNLVYREPEETGLLAYCQNNDVFLVAWRPVGKGDLLQNTPMILKEMCQKYQKTPAQIAINWLVSQPGVLTLSKTRNIEHLEENLGALNWEMTNEDIERIRREFPDRKKISDVVPLR